MEFVLIKRIAIELPRKKAAVSSKTRGSVKRGRNKSTMRYLNRQENLDWMWKWKDQPLMKVVTGVRRSGKTALFSRFQDALTEQGIEKEQILSMDLESPNFDYLTDFQALNQYLEKQISPQQKYYVFLNELHHVQDWERTAAWLLSLGNCDVYVSMSCNWECSEKEKSLLGGEAVCLELFPLSFREFQNQQEGGQDSLTEIFEKYLSDSSFPYAAQHDYSGQEAAEYLRGLYYTIMLNDVVKRQKVADAGMLEAIARLLMAELGSRTSPASIANALTAKGQKIDQKTVDRYLHGLTESCLFYEVRRYHIKNRQLLTTMNKFYLCDPAFGNMLAKSGEKRPGAILENVVFLELKRRYPEVYNGQLGASGEIDFVALRNSRPVYFQVAESTADEKDLLEKLTPLQQIRDNYPKYLLTMDEGEEDFDGILRLNLLQWLME